MIHPDTELRWINDRVGRGVVATRPIPKGTILWTQCRFDLVFTPEALSTLPPAYREIAKVYGYVDRQGDTILCWDLGRYVNHSCDPAMLAVGPHIEIAVRDLRPGDELTCDYGTLNYAEPLACQCGRPACRGKIRPEDALAVGNSWDPSLRQALAAAARVSQPLLPYVMNPGEWQGYLEGRTTPPTPDAYYFAALKPQP